MLINVFLDAIIIIAGKFLAWGKTARFILQSPSYMVLLFLYKTALQVMYLLFTTIAM